MISTPATPLSLATMSPAQTLDQSIDDDRVGPHPSYIQVSRLFQSETKLQEQLKATNMPEAREDAMRLQGVTWIDNTRKALRLPVRTFDTSCLYYHRFRLAQADGDYGFIDHIAAAALFTSCKIEDTQKRSRDILCAAHNLKLASTASSGTTGAAANPSADQATADDPRFEAPSKSVVGLERIMLESSAFDFRSTCPQKLVVKLARHYNVAQATVGRTAYACCCDLYRTFAPLKQSTQTLALACVELAGRLHGEHVRALEESRGYRRWHTAREQVMETMQDLLELYIQHGTKGSTTVGAQFTVEEFIAVRIPLNQEASKEGLPRFVGPTEPASLSVSSTNLSATSLSASQQQQLQKKKKGPPTQPAADAAGSSSSNANGASLRNGRSGPPSGKPSPTTTTSPRGDSATNKTTTNTPGGLDSPSTPRREQREARAQGTVRFMLDGDSARDEKAVVDRFFRVEEEEVEIEEEIDEAKHRQQEREKEREREREAREQARAEREREREARVDDGGGHLMDGPEGGGSGGSSRGSHRGRGRARGWPDRGGRDRHHGRGGSDRFRDRDRDDGRFRDSHYDREHARDRRRG